MTEGYCSLAELCETEITDGTHQTPVYSEQGYIFLSSKDVTDGVIDWEHVKHIPENLHKELYARVKPQVDDTCASYRPPKPIRRLRPTHRQIEICHPKSIGLLELLKVSLLQTHFGWKKKPPGWAMGERTFLKRCPFAFAWLCSFDKENIVSYRRNSTRLVEVSSMGVLNANRRLWSWGGMAHKSYSPKGRERSFS